MINKKIIYSTEHITEINIPESKSKRNIYISNTGHRGKQQVCNQISKTKQLQQSDDQWTKSTHQNNETEEVGDTLVEVLIYINFRKSSTETMIVPETQDNDIINFFLLNSSYQ